MCESGSVSVYLVNASRDWDSLKSVNFTFFFLFCLYFLSLGFFWVTLLHLHFSFKYIIFSEGFSCFWQIKTFIFSLLGTYSNELKTIQVVFLFQVLQFIIVIMFFSLCSSKLPFLHWVVVVVVSIPLPLSLSEIGSRSGQLRKMLISSAEKGEILIPQSPVCSMSVPESIESPQPVPLLYTDVNVVPEHEMNELEKSITTLQGK